MTVQPFNAEMIEAYLEARGLRFFRSQEDNEFLVLFAVGTRQLHVHLQATGLDNDLFSIWVTTADTYSADYRWRLLELVNQWNRDRRWPSASVRETADPARISLFGENHYPLSEGIHFDACAAFADCTIATSATLFEEVTHALELPSAASMESWLREAG
jgi:hypothetical protein